MTWGQPPPAGPPGHPAPAPCQTEPVAGKHEGTVLGLGIRCFGELSAGFSDVCTCIASNRVDLAADCPVEAPAWLMGLCGFLGDLSCT